MDKKIAKIMVSEEDLIITKILTISFPTEEALLSLFTPNLANIGFVCIGNSISINLKNPNFRDYFNDWVERFLAKLSSTDTIEVLINKFNYEIKSLMLLGQKGKEPSKSAVLGLYGELLMLNKLIEENKMSQFKLIDGWHRPVPAIHDFDYDDYSIEVKTITRLQTTIHISSEDQLSAIEQKELYLKLFRVEEVERSNFDSLGLLYLDIISKLEPSLVNAFEMKCAEDKFCQYLGPQHMPLDFKFKVIEEQVFSVDQTYFPRICKEQLLPGISRISYNLDISCFLKFKINL